MIPKGKGLPCYVDDATLNQILGRAMVGHQTIDDVWTLLDHLQLLEHVLDEEIDMADGLGSEGWRHHMQAVAAGWARPDAETKPKAVVFNDPRKSGLVT